MQLQVACHWEIKETGKTDRFNKTFLCNACQVHKRAFCNVLRQLSFTSQERETYEGHLKWLFTKTTAIEDAQDKIIINMLKKGLSIDEISDLTDLPIERVKEIEL